MQSNGRICFGLFALLVTLLFLPLQGVSAGGHEKVKTNEYLSAGTDIGTRMVDGVVQVNTPVIPSISQPITELPIFEHHIQFTQAPGQIHDLTGKTNAAFTISRPSEEVAALLLDQRERLTKVAGAGFETPIPNFDGGGYTGVTHPDTSGDVGPNHYIHMINGGSGAIVRIYDKSGNLLAGPTALSALGTGVCASGAGNGHVLYDNMADRWLLSEVSAAGNGLCVYVSQSPDPVKHGWYAYQFSTPDFPDYAQIGVWSDAYYASSDESGSAAYALPRMKMLDGLPAGWQRFQISELPGFSFQALTPADLDGATPPTDGAPGYFMRHRDDEAHNVGSNDPVMDYLELWSFHVDWDNPANSSFTGPLNIPISEFDSELCGYTSLACFGMPGVPTGSAGSLDPLREVIMPRLVYRRFATHEVLIGNFVTDVDNSDHGGIRWFELRKTEGNPWTLHQEGTVAPDDDNRWMGAIAMDGSGNIALGYNVSGDGTYPSLRYSGRLINDPLGTLPQGEAVLKNGSATSGSNRYGDYSAMSVDPTDECTFWFTGEYNASSTWSTRIGAFRFDACGPPDFTLAVVPEKQAVCTGSEAGYAIEVGQVTGYTDPVTLSVSGAPAGVTSTFDPNPVTPPGSSQLTMSNAASTAAGEYLIDVSGSGTSGSHNSQVTLHVATSVPQTPSPTYPGNNAANIVTQPTFNWSEVEYATGYTLEIATNPDFINIVYSATGIDGNGHKIDTELDNRTIYYWRVRAGNGCGTTDSAVYSFSTVYAPGECSLGDTPNYLLTEDFEAGSPGWTHGGNGDTWTLSTVGPRSGIYAYHAANVDTVSDQYLDSPEVTLPSDQRPLSLQFWNYQVIEDFGDGCADGAVLEISTNGGASWTRLEGHLETDPYDGPISSDYENPLGGDNAWCGDPQDWLNSVVSLNAFVGQTVRFRFRLATDSSVSREGWYIDDLIVQSCQSLCQAPPPVTDAVIMRDDLSETGIWLFWTDTGADEYEIHSQANVPYFVPDTNTLVATTSNPNYMLDNQLGNVDNNNFYVVVPKNSCGPPAAHSNRLGEFDFSLVPGN